MIFVPNKFFKSTVFLNNVGVLKHPRQRETKQRSVQSSSSFSHQRVNFFTYRTSNYITHIRYQRSHRSLPKPQSCDCRNSLHSLSVSQSLACSKDTSYCLEQSNFPSTFHETCDHTLVLRIFVLCHQAYPNRSHSCCRAISVFLFRSDRNIEWTGRASFQNMHYHRTDLKLTA